MKLTLHVREAAICAVFLVGCASQPERTDRSEENVSAATRATAAPTEAIEEPVEPAPDAPLARALVKLVVFDRAPHGPRREFRADMIDEVEAGLRRELDVDVERIEAVPLPESAWYPARRRYRADRLLDFLRDHLDGEPSTTRVIGLTAVDISTTKGRHEDWGVFGLGDIGGRACVISSFRLSERGRRHDELVTFRVVTTAVHEVGHTLGLPHCNDPRGVMRDAEGSIRTVDTSDGHLGPICRERIERTAPRVLPYREAD